MAQTRNTTQLTVVREALYALANHPTADEVYKHVHAQHPSISKATVYRTLNKLASQGEALKVYSLFGPDRFDHTCSPHAHVQCKRCGAVADVAIAPDSSLFEAAEAQSGFRIDQSGIQIPGICPKCAALA